MTTLGQRNRFPKLGKRVEVQRSLGLVSKSVQGGHWMNTFALSSALTATTMLLCRVNHVDDEQVSLVLDQLESYQAQIDKLLRTRLNGQQDMRGEETSKPSGWDKQLKQLRRAATGISGARWPVIEMGQSYVNAGSVVVDEILPALRAAFFDEPGPLVRLRDAVLEQDQALMQMFDGGDDDLQAGMDYLHIVDIEGLLEHVDELGLLHERPELHRELLLAYGDFRTFDELGRRMKTTMFYGAAA